MYRILQRVRTSNSIFERGLSTLEGISESGIKTLLERGVIQLVAAPPLRILPQFEGKVDKLNEKGIYLVDDLAVAREEDLREVLGDDYRDVVTEIFNQMLPDEEDFSEEVEDAEDY